MRAKGRVAEGEQKSQVESWRELEMEMRWAKPNWQDVSPFAVVRLFRYCAKSGRCKVMRGALTSSSSGGLSADKL
jgi:hypothetical protein